MSASAKLLGHNKFHEFLVWLGAGITGSSLYFLFYKKPADVAAGFKDKRIPVATAMRVTEATAIAPASTTGAPPAEKPLA